MSGCEQELCEWWTGQGCVCATFGFVRAEACPVCGAALGSTLFCPSCEQANDQERYVERAFYARMGGTINGPRQVRKHPRGPNRTALTERGSADD